MDWKVRCVECDVIVACFVLQKHADFFAANGIHTHPVIVFSGTDSCPTAAFVYCDVCAVLEDDLQSSHIGSFYSDVEAGAFCDYHSNEPCSHRARVQDVPPPTTSP